MISASDSVGSAMLRRWSARLAPPPALITGNQRRRMANAIMSTMEVTKAGADRPISDRKRMT